MFGDKHVRIMREKLGRETNYAICLTRIEKQYISDFLRMSQFLVQKYDPEATERELLLQLHSGHEQAVLTEEPAPGISAQKDEVSVGEGLGPASTRGRWKLKRENLWTFALNKKTRR